MTETEGDAAAVATRVRWRVVGLLMAYSFLNYFNRVSMVVAGDERIMPRYGVTPTRMGLVYSAFLFAYTLFMAPGGWLVDRAGPRLTLFVLGLGSGLFVALTGLLGGPALAAGGGLVVLLSVRAGLGLFSAPIYPASGQAVARWVPAGRRAAAMGLIVGAAPLGIASTYVVFGAMIDRLDWPWAFAAAGAVTAALAIAWAVATAGEAPPSPAVRDDAPGFRWGLLGNRSLILLTLSYATVGYFEYLFFYWMHYYFEDVLHLGKARSQFYAGIPPLAMALGMPLGGWLSDRLRPVVGHRAARASVAVAGMVAGAAFLYAGVQARDPAWVVAWFALALGTTGASDVVFWTTAFEIGGRRGGTSGGICNTGGNLGGLLAPVVTPWVGETFGWPWALRLGSIVGLLGVVLWLGIDPDDRIA